MHDATRRAVRTLLDRERVLTLAVIVDGEPIAALLPFAVSDDRTRLYIHVSGLARHARGLSEGAPVGVVVLAAATADRDPMQIPRLTVRATARLVEPGSSRFEAAAGRLVERFPIAATTLGLADFTVYALELGRGRYVEGFAQAVNVGPETFVT